MSRRLIHSARRETAAIYMPTIGKPKTRKEPARLEIRVSSRTANTQMSDNINPQFVNEAYRGAEAMDRSSDIGERGGGWR